MNVPVISSYPIPTTSGTQNHHRPVNHTSLSTYFKPFSRNINTLAIIPKSFPSINPPICYALYHAFYRVPVFSMRPALLVSMLLSFRKIHLLLVLLSSVPCHCRSLSFLRLSRLSFRHNSPILQAAYIILYYLSSVLAKSLNSWLCGVLSSLCRISSFSRSSLAGSCSCHWLSSLYCLSCLWRSSCALCSCLRLSVLSALFFLPLAVLSALLVLHTAYFLPLAFFC